MLDISLALTLALTARDRRTVVEERNSERIGRYRRRRLVSEAVGNSLLDKHHACEIGAIAGIRI
ncbi:hypothetical protein ACFIOY_26600 [Bradyrhizobium sp. TZ2]